MEGLPQNTEQKELSIDTVEGLAEFLQYAKEAYEDVQSSAEESGEAGLYDVQLSQAKETFNEIESLVEHHTKVLNLGGFIYESDIDSIQSLYDNILTIKDAVDATHTDESVHWETENQDLEEDTDEDNTFVGQSQGHLEIVDESSSGSDVTIHQPIVDEHFTEPYQKPEQKEYRVSASEVETKNDIPQAVNDNGFEVYRQNLFTKNEMQPAIEKVISIPEYKRFLSEYFSSPGAFEAYLRREINAREKVSKLDSVLGIIRKSPFDNLLRDMLVSEVEEFEHEPAEQIKQFLLGKDIQYEMYVDWMHAYDVMKELVHATPNMTFGELYVRATVEDLMERNSAKAA